MDEKENKIDESKKRILKLSNVKELAVGIFYYNALSILGPILLFVGLGLLLDNYFQTKPYLTIGGLIIAFIVTNILILKRINKLTNKFKEYNAPQKSDKDKEETNNKQA